MPLRLVILLLASGVALCSYQEYFLISTFQNWSNARSYCRQKHVDLATVQDAHDVSRLIRLAWTQSMPCWIGLKTTGTASWAWSLGGDSSSLALFTNWDLSLSVISYSCGAIKADGIWVSFLCSKQLPFVCQSGGAGGSFAVHREVKTWSDAQAFCRQHGTDLASVRNPDENEAVRLLISPHQKTHSFFWIGLFRSSLRWPDGGYSSFTNWYPGQPNNDGQCVLSNKKGQWYDRMCSYSTCFYCYGRKSTKLSMRLQFKSNSKLSPFSDSVLIDNILSKIQNKYNKVKLHWIVQAGGKVFHKQV